MNSFDELCKKLTQDIGNNIVLKRSWKDDEQFRFNYAVRYLLIDLWNKHHTHPDNHLSIQKNKNFYSALKQYRDPNLTYRMAIHAFDGLQKLDMIYVVQDGYYDRIKMQGNLTRYKSTHKLIEQLNDIQGHPAVLLKPNLDIETIILRNKINGRRFLERYDNNKDTEIWRDNLRKINSCFSRHIIDIYLNDDQFTKLQDELLVDSNKEPIDLTQKLLVRIFTNKSFESGGRFFRGWWQNVPKHYRQFITIDGKNTREFDFSQLNPNMIYAAYNLELGSEDAYDRVLDGEHRDTVKQAFNAMIQASTALTSKPENIDLDPLGMTWRDLRQAVLDAHKPIQHLFFTGLGNQLQFEDSSIAESIMLQFAAIDAPALPIHDSFIMHHGYASELEENMRRGFYERFGRDINVKHEMVEEIINNEENDIELKSLTFDEIIEGDKERTQWTERSDLWFKTVNP